jgi:hypothetical protein
VAEAGLPPEKTVSFADVPGAPPRPRGGSITATVTSVVDYTMAKKRAPALRAGAFVGPAAAGPGACAAGTTRCGLPSTSTWRGPVRSGSWNRPVIRHHGQDALDVLGRAR